MNKKEFLNNINYFRGLAIVFIVLGHCISFGVSNFNENKSLIACIINYILPGGTNFFVFISGYLLHHIYYRKLKVSDFF